MAFPVWFQSLLTAKRLRKRRCRVQPAGTPTRARLRLALELLEDRSLPSGLGITADSATSRVTVFEPDTFAAFGSVALPAPNAVGDVAILGNGSLGFATNFSSQVVAINLTTPSTPTVAAVIPIANFGEDISITADQQYLVVSDGSAVQPLSVIRVSTLTQIGTFATGADSNSVDVTSAGSVLVSSAGGTVRRLTINAAGTITNTGEIMAAGGEPNNVYSSPDGNFGVVVNRSASNMRSFAVNGMTQVNTRGIAGFGISGVFSPAGDRFYVRTQGAVQAFTFNSATGALGAAPLFSIPIVSTPTFYGMDQMAISPDGSKLYVSQPGAIRIFSTAGGGLLGLVLSPSSIVSPTGVTIQTPTNVAPSDLVLNSGTIGENDVFTLTGTFTDPNALDVHTVTVNWGLGEGSTMVTLPVGDRSFSITHQYLDDNPTGTSSDIYPVSVTVSDGTDSTTAETSVTVNNLPVEIVALSLESASIDEGGSASLTVDWTDTGTQDTFIVTIDWGDGTIENIPAPASLSGASSQTYTHTYRDDGGTVFVDSGFPLGWLNLTPGNGTASDVYPISVTVTDDDGSRDSDTTSITVNNVAPAVSEISGVPLTDDPDECNTTWVVSGEFNDPGTDTYRFEISWGDGTISIFNVPGFMGFPAPDSTDIPPPGPYGPFGLVAEDFPGSATHTYGAFGTYVITVKVLDDDGGSTSAMVGAVAVEATAEVITDSLGAKILDIHGTDFDDHITVNKSDDAVLGTVYMVHANSWAEPRIYAAAGIERIRITLCDGDDQATVSSGIQIPAFIFGNAGNDRINGGGGRNVMLGGSGVDDIVGGKADDILIGGADADRLVGNAGNDILIGGTTDYDHDYVALVGLLANPSLLTTSTVHDDNAIDVLTGSSGTDTIFAQLDGPFADIITDSAEVLFELP